MATPERIVLVDGSALVYRAFFAIPPQFRTAAGLHTNAIYGFATMFKKLMAGRTPRYGAVVFDAPGKTFREEQYPQYKAQRPSMQSELRQQLASIDRLVEAHNFPLLRVPGYEADDVIGTLTREAVAAGLEVRIVSGDKDFAQLISDKVRMLDTLRDISYDPELVKNKWGVEPHQFVDLLALVGDKVDNIPGVPGIGQKGAATLLAKYGTLDNLLASTDELKGRQKKTLEENADLAKLSKDLATIELHTPLPLGLEDLELTEPTQSQLNELYREFEFFSLLGEDDEADVSQNAVDTDYLCVLESPELEDVLAKVADAEHVLVLPVFDGHSPVHGKVTGFALSWEEHTGAYIAFQGDGASRDTAALLETLKVWCENSGQQKIAYNAKFLIVALRRLGIELKGIEGDVLLESFLVDPTKLVPHDLESISKEYLHRSLPKPKKILGVGKQQKRYSELSVEKVSDYQCLLADIAWQVWPMLREMVVERDHLDYLRKVELPLSQLLSKMEATGILVDPDDLRSMGDEFGERLRSYEKRIHTLAGHEFNIASTKQLSKVLFEELELPVIKRTKSGYSTNAEVLERLAPKHDIAGLLLEHRKLSKLINTYTDVLQREVSPATGRIHSTFQLTAGATGRLISTDPDLQRTPVKTAEGKRIRQTFVAKPGHLLLCADWSQIELRLLAHVSGDELLVDAFTRDDDIHARTAAQIFGIGLDEVETAQRNVGKLVNFSTIYGQGATALGKIIGVTRKEAQSYIDDYFVAYRGVRTWLDETMLEADQYGYVTTLTGRRRYIPELSSNSFVERQAGERIAANTPIQGSAADLCKLVMVSIDEEMRTRGVKSRMLLQIHDELVFEVPECEADSMRELVKHHMENTVTLSVPLKVDIGVGPNWAVAKG